MNNMASESPSRKDLAGAKKRTLTAMAIAAIVAFVAVFLFDGAGPSTQDRAAALLELWIYNVVVWVFVLWGFDRLRTWFKTRG